MDRLTLPKWVTGYPGDVSLRRLLDGEPSRVVGDVTVAGYAGFGDCTVDQITTTGLTALRDEVWRSADQVKMNSPGHAHCGPNAEPGHHGQGAARNFARVAKRVFSEMEHERLLTYPDPTRQLRPPPYSDRRRALTRKEVARLRVWIRLARKDPDLDLVILDLLERSAARRGGLVALTLGGLDLRGCWLITWQKNRQMHRVPVARSVLRRARDLALTRGAIRPDDKVLRYADGRPIPKQYITDLFNAAQHAGLWPPDEPVSAHWLRHTTLTRLERKKGKKVSRTWAHHRRTAEGTIGIYTGDAQPRRLRKGAEAVFGPLKDEPLQP